MYSKGTIFLSFSDAFGKAKSTNDVLSRKTLRKEQKICSFCGESHSSCSQKEQFFCPFLMHLARQKVQMTFFFLERWRSEKNQKKIVLFVVRAILHVVKRNNFFVLFWCIWQGKKYKWLFFSRKTTLRKEQKKNALFVERAILHVVKRNNFFVLFWCIWQGKKYKWRFFSRKMTFRKEQNNCSFCGESHSSCSQKEQFFLSFSDAFGKAKSTNYVLF